MNHVKQLDTHVLRPLHTSFRYFLIECNDRSSVVDQGGRLVIAMLQLMPIVCGHLVLIILPGKVITPQWVTMASVLVQQCCPGIPPVAAVLMATYSTTQQL
jgi:hypothetical protein